MPIYEYKCGQCGLDFETLVRSNREEVQCPDCQSSEVVKQMSAASFKSSGKFTSTAGGSCSGCSSSSCSSCH